MKLKYLILSLVIVFIILIILVIIKPKWFFKSNNNADFKRTSQNGDMTLNPLSNTVPINNFTNVPPPQRALQQPPPQQPQQPLQPQRPQPLQPQRPQTNPNNIRQYIRQENTRNVRQRRQNNLIQPDDNIRPPDPVRIDILIPRNENLIIPRNENLNHFVDMLFNDTMAFLQQIPNNEFNFIQHMNENNFHPIILNDNTLLMDILDNHILDIIGAHRDNIIQTRQDTARENAETANQAVNNYLDIAALPTNDAQNVHDHTVLAGFKMILERLKSEQSDELESLDDIINEVKKRGRMYSDNRPQITIQALSVIEKMKEGEQILALEINGEPTTDAMCLQLVWNRANHPQNAEKCHMIKQAIFDNLLDCWEDDAIFGEKKIVCVTGRATRMLGSLTLLDFDQRNWEVKKFEDFKNEIFKNVKDIIKMESENAANSSNVDLQNAGRLYLATTVEEMQNITQPSEDATATLNNIIKNKISDMIDNYVNKLEQQFFTEIPPYMKNSVKKEALASIDLF